MALDTIPTSISSEVVISYIQKLDERGEPYQFLVETCNSRKIDLALFRDGATDALTIKLNVDGTWTAEHALVIGEKT